MIIDNLRNPPDSKATISEGMKISQNTTNELMNDKNIFMGFEIELSRDEDREDEDREDEDREDEDYENIYTNNDDIINIVKELKEYGIYAIGIGTPDQRNFRGDDEYELEIRHFSELTFYDIMDDWEPIDTSPFYNTQDITNRIDTLFKILGHQHKIDTNEINITFKKFNFLYSILGDHLYLLLHIIPATGVLGSSRDEDQDEIIELIEEINPNDWPKNKQEINDIGDKIEWTWILDPENLEMSQIEWFVKPDDTYDVVAEITSPVFSLEQGLKHIQNIFTMIKNNKRGYNTNRQCGLHINISYNDDNNNLDKLKLALLIGEDHMLEEFGRIGNSFTTSQLEHLSIAIAHELKSGGNPLSRKKLDDALKYLGQKLIHNEKNYSINFSNLRQKGYIEFRIMGGSDYHEQFNEVRRNIIKLALSLKISFDKKLFRNEYLKKVYKLLNSYTKYDQEMDEFIKNDSIATNISKLNNNENTMIAYKYMKNALTNKELTKDEKSKLILDVISYAIYNKSILDILFNGFLNKNSIKN